MALSCLCGLKNYGRGQCTTVIGTPVSVALQNRIDSSGVVNRIDLNAAFTLTTLNGLITNVDTKKRIVLLPRMKGMDLPIADTVFDEATDGTKSFVRDGIWGITGEVRDKDAVPPTQKKLKKIRCNDASAYIVTEENQLVGQLSVDGNYMLPLELNTASADPKMMFKNSTTTNKIMFAVDFDNIVKQENLYVLDGEELGIDFRRMQQLTDVNLVIGDGTGDVTTTTVTWGAATDYVNGLKPNFDVFGLTDPTDWVLRNLTDASTVTFTSVVEISDGKYTGTYVAQTAGDEMELSAATTVNFYVGSTTYTAE